jgi:hypothetical protein
MSRWLVELIEKRLHEVLIPIDPNNPVCRVDLRAGLIELEDVRLHAAFLSRNYTLPVEARAAPPVRHTPPVFCSTANAVGHD